ncbi:hypothetical protein UFOVP606_48 [uncultured Caudovirales phage]|uniref:Uncharacterized protein n=1 Tax=uncultured Caudovirales phage TaxID=2100421 RepID=A0A6J5N253_9CAUD|nr:hypothetical protein UFOVP606_48 [uncultured Caudovirales phage]
MKKTKIWSEILSSIEFEDHITFTVFENGKQIKVKRKVISFWGIMSMPAVRYNKCRLYPVNYSEIIAVNAYHITNFKTTPPRKHSNY